jgi:hypothetical protein
VARTLDAAPGSPRPPAAVAALLGRSAAAGGILAPRDVLLLQRHVGNRAVSGLLARDRIARRPPGPATVQRAMRVERVDFNPDVAAQLEAVGQPVDDAFRDFEVHADDLKPVLRPYLLPNVNAAAYPAGNAVLGLPARQAIHPRLQALADNAVDLAGADVPALAAAIAAHLRQDTALSVGEAARFQRAVETAVAAGSFQMAAEAGGGVFDQMIVNAGAGASRAKERPTAIDVADLPGGVRAAVEAIAGQIQARNVTLTTPFTGTQFSRELTHEEVARQATTGFAAVRTMHTNQSGWLPAVAVDEVLDLNQANTRIYAAAHRPVRKALRKRREMPTDSHKRKYTALVEGELGALTQRQRIEFFWSNYSQNATGELYPYVEFSVGNAHLSRLCYDYVGGNFFVSFHYRWHKGFNPFFHVGGLQDV